MEIRRKIRGCLENVWEYLPCMRCLLILEDLLHLPTCRNVAVTKLPLHFPLGV